MQERDDPDDWKSFHEDSAYAAAAAAVERLGAVEFYGATGMPEGIQRDLNLVIPLCEQAALESAHLTLHETAEEMIANGANGPLLAPWREHLAVSYEQQPPDSGPIIGRVRTFGLLRTKMCVSWAKYC